jgi:hypothetical protein
MVEGRVANLVGTEPAAAALIFDPGSMSPHEKVKHGCF